MHLTYSSQRSVFRPARFKRFHILQRSWERPSPIKGEDFFKKPYHLSNFLPIDGGGQGGGVCLTSRSI